MTAAPTLDQPTLAPLADVDIQLDVMQSLIDARVQLERERAVALLADGLPDEIIDCLDEAADLDRATVAGMLDMLDLSAGAMDAVWQLRGIVDQAVAHERERISLLVEAIGGSQMDLDHLSRFQQLVDARIEIDRAHAYSDRPSAGRRRSSNRSGGTRPLAAAAGIAR